MNKIGKFGEDIGALFLKKHGYSIVERNYSRKWGELDIVAKKNGNVCFVEVKTIKDVTCGTKTFKSDYRPEENMNAAKIKKFSRIIQTYIQEKGIDSLKWTAALLAIRVNLEKKTAKVRFIDPLVIG